jgi:hypothetical protein
LILTKRSCGRDPAGAATLDLDQMVNRNKGLFCAFECAEAGMNSSSAVPSLLTAGYVTASTHQASAIDCTGRR